MGVSMVTLTMGDHEKGNDLITELYSETLLADTYFSSVIGERTFITGRGNIGESNRFRMTAITSDDRVAELIEKVVKFTGGHADSTPSDILVTPVSGSSKEYAEWAKL